MSRIRREFWDPEGERYGLPTYWWGGAPAGYATRRQLRAQGLRPGGQPIAAQVLWRGRGGVRVAYLYSVELAKPKREATPANLAAVEKALAARRVCPTCNEQRDYYIPHRYGECLDCAPGLPPPFDQQDDADDRMASEEAPGGPGDTSDALAKLQRAREAVGARRGTGVRAPAGEWMQLRRAERASTDERDAMEV